MIKAVIFDMDGLLVDTEPIWQDVEMELFGKLGVKLTREMTHQTVGLRTDEVVRYWHHRFQWDGIEDLALAKQITETVIQEVKDKGAPLPGVHKTIELLEKANVPMAIASSSPAELIEAVIDKLDVRNKISVFHSAAHEEYGKPHPAVYLSAAKSLDIPPEHCLAFEDSINGVISAKAARMHCVAVPDRNLRGDKRYGAADLVLDSLDDFTLELVANW